MTAPPPVATATVTALMVAMVVIIVVTVVVVGGAILGLAATGGGRAGRGLRLLGSPLLLHLGECIGDTVEKRRLLLLRRPVLGKGSAHQTHQS